MQVAVLVASSALVLVWQAVVRPMKRRVAQFLEIVNEAVVLGVLLALAALLVWEREFGPAESKTVGWVCVALLVLCVLVNVGFLIPTLMLGVVQAVRECRSRKSS